MSATPTYRVILSIMRLKRMPALINSFNLNRETFINQNLLNLLKFYTSIKKWLDPNCRVSDEQEWSFVTFKMASIDNMVGNGFTIIKY